MNKRIVFLKQTVLAAVKGGISWNCYCHWVHGWAYDPDMGSYCFFPCSLLVRSYADTHCCCWSCYRSSMSLTCCRKQGQKVYDASFKRCNLLARFALVSHFMCLILWKVFWRCWVSALAMIQQPRAPSSGLMPASDVFIRAKEVSLCLSVGLFHNRAELEIMLPVCHLTWNFKCSESLLMAWFCPEVLTCTK